MEHTSLQDDVEQRFAQKRLASQVRHGCYFKDGKRRADYAVVFEEERIDILKTFVTNLRGSGFDIEIADGRQTDYKFMLIHSPKSALKHFANVFDIGEIDNKVDFGKEQFLSRHFYTPISEPPELSEETFTSCNRIMIIHKVLESVRFDVDQNACGIQLMISMRLVVTAYPLHDGPADLSFEITDDGLNDRQLLMKYWANFGMAFKTVPVDMIHRYYGCEIAYYFAWVEHFNLILLLPSIFGILTMICSVIMASSSIVERVDEFCNSDLIICPKCYHSHNCKFWRLSDFCNLFKGNFMFDNYITIVYTMLCCVLMTLGYCKWIRQWHKYQIKWGVTYDDDEIGPRRAYVEKTAKRYNPRTKRVEPYVSKHEKTVRVAFSLAIVIFMIILAVMVVMGVAVLKIFMGVFIRTYIAVHLTILKLIVGSVIQVSFIKFFGRIYTPVSIWLTDIENPRLQRDYDSSVVYKRYVLSFANNYAPLFYISYFKGTWYGEPGTNSLFTELDNCQPASCTSDLAINLFFIIAFKRLVGNILVLFLPYIKNFLSRLFRRKKVVVDPLDLPQYEVEFDMAPTNRYLLTSEYCEMVINYGFVMLFIAMCPFSPAITLINNLIEQRIDAIKIVARYRRPVPRNVRGIGAWQGILRGTTYLAAATNGILICANGETISNMVFQWQDKSLFNTFANYTLSLYEVERSKLYGDSPNAPKYCYYKGMRYPPGHEDQYKPNGIYYEDLALRLILLLIFEHFVMLTITAASGLIPDYPTRVRQQLRLNKQLAKESNLWSLLKDHDEMKVHTDENGLYFVYASEKKEDYSIIPEPFLKHRTTTNM